MYGEYTVDMQGRKVFEGEYFRDEVLNERRGDKPPQVYQNHANCREEIENMVRFMETASQMLGLQKCETAEKDIETAEKRLGVRLPDMVRALYLAVDKDYELTGSKRRLLKPEELFIKDNVLAVLCHGKRKKVYLGIDLAKPHSMLWEESVPGSGWEYEYCMESFCEMMIQGAAMEAVSKMPFHGVYKIKGYPARQLHATELLEESFQPLFVRFDGYYNRYCSVMLNQDTRTIAWLRAGEFYSDIQIGSYDSEVLEQFKKIRGEDGYVEKQKSKK